MQPNTTNPNEMSDTFRRYRPLAIIGAGVLVVIIIAAALIMNQFKITGTSPDVSKVATIAPFFNVNFNKTLSSKNLSVTSSPAAISSTAVDGQTLKIKLDTYGKELDPKKTYTITIKSIQANDGQRITNREFSFTPQKLALKEVPPDQQMATKEWQKQENPPQKSDIDFENEDALFDNGMTSDQIDSIEQAFWKFIPSAQVITIDPQNRTVDNGPIDPIAGTSSSLFDVQIDANHYRATVILSSPSTIQLILVADSGKQVFDSGQVDTSTESDN